MHKKKNNNKIFFICFSKYPSHVLLDMFSHFRCCKICFERAIQEYHAAVLPFISKTRPFNSAQLSADTRREKISPLLCWNKTQSTRSLLYRVSYVSFWFSFQHPYNLTNFLYLWGQSVIFYWLWYLFI